jgi:Gylcosyl hydrolase family 115 C-terminal domain
MTRCSTHSSATASPARHDTAMNNHGERNTSNSVDEPIATHLVARSGHRVLPVWMVDTTVLLQRGLDTGGQRPSYGGPPESRRVRRR